MEVVPKDTSEPKHLHDFSPSYFTGDEDLSMERMRSDFHRLIGHFSAHRPSYISTPFQGTCLKMTSNHKSFVFASRDGRIATCDINNKQLTLDSDVREGSIWSVDLTKDDKSMYAAGVAPTIKKFSLSTLDEEVVLQGHTGEVNHVILSMDDKTLFSCSDDRSDGIFTKTPARSFTLTQAWSTAWT